MYIFAEVLSIFYGLCYYKITLWSFKQLLIFSKFAVSHYGLANIL